MAQRELSQEAKEIKNLLERAQNGDVAVLPKLSEILKDPFEVNRLGGDLARQAQLKLIYALSGKDLVLRESVIRKLELMRAELEGTNPSALEKLLVDRIVSCWLHLHHLEVMCVQRAKEAFEVATYYQRSIDRAQKRYLAAIRTLAIIRKLAIPVLQVNVARKQVNVAGTYVDAKAKRTGQQKTRRMSNKNKKVLAAPPSHEGKAR